SASPTPAAATTAATEAGTSGASDDSKSSAAPAAPAGAASTDEEFEQMVQNLMGMNFPRDQVINALNLTFRNPDRAAELLFSGQVPEVCRRASFFVNILFPYLV